MVPSGTLQREFMWTRTETRRRLQMGTWIIALASSSLVVLAVAAGVSATSFAQAPQATFQGVWRTLEVVVPGATARTFKPEAALAIFHGRHYTRIEVHAEQPRPLLADQATASADQLRAAWGPFVGEAGTFELSGTNTITMQARVAKNPAAMKNGATSVYTYLREGNVLTLTQVRSHTGPIANPITVKLIRIE
jgi:hypothetical protein